MPDAKNTAAALGICVGLASLLCLAPLMPCEYGDAADGTYAGCGYHSLVKVMANGLEWDSNTVPVPYERYSGTGPYIGTASGWILALYIPIFAAIIFFGGLIVNGAFTRPSRTSGIPLEQTPRSRTRR